MPIFRWAKGKNGPVKKRFRILKWTEWYTEK